MRTILLSLMVIGAVAVLIGNGTVAYFTDFATSDGSAFTAGTLNLDISNNGGTWDTSAVTGSWQSPNNWAPGQVFTQSVYLRNTGSLDVKYLAVDWHGLSGYAGLADKIEVVTWKEYSGATTLDVLAAPQSFSSRVGNGDAVLTLRELIESYKVGLEPYGNSPCTTPKSADEFGKCVDNTSDYDDGMGAQFLPGPARRRPASPRDGLQADGGYR